MPLPPMPIAGLDPYDDPLAPKKPEDPLAMPNAGPPPLDAAGGGAPAPAPVAPAAPPAGAAPLSVFPPEQNKTVSTDSTVAPSPIAAKALADHTRATDALVDATNRKADADTKVLQAEANADKMRADKALELEKKRQEEDHAALQRREEAQAAAQEHIAAAQADVDQKYAQTGKGFFTDKPWGYKLLAGLAVWSSTKNSYLLGTDPNDSPIQRTLNQLITQDSQKRMNDYLKSKEFLAERKKGPEAVKSAYALKQAEISARHAQELKILEAEADQMKKSAKADPAIVETAQAVIRRKAEQENAKAQFGLGEHYDRKHSEARTLVDPKAAGAEIDSRSVPNLDGSPAGLAPTKEEAVKARGELATLGPIVETLKRVKDRVGGAGLLDRVPIAGKYTDRQQLISGDLNTLEAPISQLLGSGTPQEKEALRRLKTLSVSVGQGSKVSKENIDSLIDYVQQSYVSRAKSLVPSAKDAPKRGEPQGKVASLDGVSKERLQRGLARAKAAGDKEAIAEFEAALKGE